MSGAVLGFTAGALLVCSCWLMASARTLRRMGAPARVWRRGLGYAALGLILSLAMLVESGHG